MTEGVTFGSGKTGWTWIPNWTRGTAIPFLTVVTAQTFQPAISLFSGYTS